MITYLAWNSCFSEDTFGSLKIYFSDNFVFKNSAQIQNFTSWHCRVVNLVDFIYHVCSLTKHFKSRFSSLLAAADVLRGGIITSATQRQKFRHWWRKSMFTNRSGSNGVPNANLFNFTVILVDFGKVVYSSANELLQNLNAYSREEYIPQILTILL